MVFKKFGEDFELFSKPPRKDDMLLLLSGEDNKTYKTKRSDLVKPENTNDTFSTSMSASDYNDTYPSLVIFENKSAEAIGLSKDLFPYDVMTATHTEPKSGSYGRAVQIAYGVKAINPPNRWDTSVYVRSRFGGSNFGTWKELAGLPADGKAGDVLTKNSTTDSTTKWSSPLRPLFVARGAVYNEATGYYELNGLTDITEEEMIEIYNYTSQSLSGNYWKGSCSRTNIRTNFANHIMYGPISENTQINLYYASQTFAGCSKLEKVVLYTGRGAATRRVFKECEYMFFMCDKLKEVEGELELFNGPTSIKGIFDLCNSLESVKIFGLDQSISFKNSPNLTRDSIIYLINKSRARSEYPMTLTLHATAKARLTEADIALASSKYITIA